MPSLVLFEEYDIMTSSDEEPVDDCDTVQRNNEDPDLGDKPEDRPNKTVAETEPGDNTDSNVEKDKDKMLRDGTNEPVLFFHTWYTDKKGVFRKRRKKNWKVAARKQFQGYFHCKGSKVRSTMVKPSPPSPEGL